MPRQRDQPVTSVDGRDQPTAASLRQQKDRWEGARGSSGLEERWRCQLVKKEFLRHGHAEAKESLFRAVRGPKETAWTP